MKKNERADNNMEAITTAEAEHKEGEVKALEPKQEIQVLPTK